MIIVTDAVIYKKDHSVFSSFAKVWTEHLVAQWLPPCLSPAVSRGRYLTHPYNTQNLTNVNGSPPVKSEVDTSHLWATPITHSYSCFLMVPNPITTPSQVGSQYLTPLSHTHITPNSILQLHANTSKWFTPKVDIDTSLKTPFSMMNVVGLVLITRIPL